SGALWSAFVKAATNALPAPFSCEFGRPATDTVTPFAAAPASWITDETGVKPSGSRIFTPGAPAAMSLISLPPFSQISAPTNTAWAPDALILTASDSYDDAFGSNAVKPTDLMPSFVAALRMFVATPRP